MLPEAAACSLRPGTPCPRSGTRDASPVAAGWRPGGAGPRPPVRPRLGSAHPNGTARGSGEGEIAERPEHGAALTQTRRTRRGRDGVLGPHGVRDGDRAELQRRARSKAEPARVAQRARIVLLAEQGLTGPAIAGRVGCSEPTVTT